MQMRQKHREKDVPFVRRFIKEKKRETERNTEKEGEPKKDNGSTFTVHLSAKESVSFGCDRTHSFYSFIHSF